MKTVTGVSLQTWRELFDRWEKGGLTDVVMTRDRIYAYYRGELVYTEELSEEDIISFVSETVSAEDEREWANTIREGKLFKYSFIIGSLLVRCSLWETGLHLRFLPVGSRNLLGMQDEAVSFLEGQTLIVHKGPRGSGKTRALIAQVCLLSAKLDERVVVYADVQEIYVREPKGLVLFVGRKKVRSARDFYDLAKCFASTVVIQYPREEEVEIIKKLHQEGVKVLVEGNVNIPSAFEINHD